MRIFWKQLKNITLKYHVYITYVTKSKKKLVSRKNSLENIKALIKQKVFN
jgi:hypothetical protein